MEELKYFFSYARNDSEFVLKLAKELRAVGANLWLDQLDILGGQHWDSTVEKALKSCKGMIAVLSPESVASDNVMDEVSYALNEGKLVVPVLIRPCNIPYRLQRVQYIDFTADYDTGFSQLLRALGIEQPVQPPESTADQEPVVRDSTEPLEEKPTEPLVLEKQTAQELEKPIPDEIDHPKPTGLETEKAWSKSQKTKVIAAICIVALIVIVSIVVFLKYRQPKTYRLDIPHAVGGSVTKDPNQASYNDGDNVTLQAVADAGYTFTGWSGDLPDSNNSAELVMNADMSVTASFALKTYRLDIPHAVGGSVTKDPNQANYNDGDNVTLQAVADAGYTFTGWSGDLSDSNNPAELVMNADKSVTVSFALKTYRLDIPHAVGGSVTKDPNQASYKHGETVTLEAVPNTGYSFTNWSGDLSDSNNPDTLVMDVDKSVTASFGLKTYSLTVNAVNGVVTKSPDQASYNHGETVTLEADPNIGYSFTKWSGGLSGSTNPDMLVMDADKSVTARFDVWEFCSDWYAKDYYSKSLSVDPKGPSSGTTRRSLRGGSWNLVESNLRCSVRDYYNPINRYSSVIGFRVVRSQ